MRTPVAAFAAPSSISGASGASEHTPRHAVPATAPIVSVQSRGLASSTASRARRSRTRSSSMRSAVMSVAPTAAQSTGTTADDVRGSSHLLHIVGSSDRKATAPRGASLRRGGDVATPQPLKPLVAM